MRRPRAARILFLLLVASCSATAPPADAERSAVAEATRGPLARVQPPRPPCLPAVRSPSATDLAARAREALGDGHPDAALACAEEALVADPRSLDALRVRMRALADLGRPEEARAATARALAADADDPATLAAAAEILVGRLGARDDLEAGRDLALRGAARVLAGPRPDPAAATRLRTVAAMAENDLGRSREALRHADLALRDRPGDADALYERGVALFELCRFADARRTFQQLLRRSPDDPWALRHLGLIAERAGDDTRARSLLARAARLAPREIGEPVELARPAFEAEVGRAVAELPEADRRDLAGVPVEVEEIPLLADLTATDPPLSPSILGLFRGPSLGEPCEPGDGPACRSIVLYRRNLARFARDRDELAEQIRVTLLHEIGHLRGESDDGLRGRGLE
jgi:predicted Zn-dependent protease with MMP-like domain